MSVVTFAIDFHLKAYHFVPTLDLEHMGLQEMERLQQCDLDLRLLYFSGSKTKLDMIDYILSRIIKINIFYQILDILLNENIVLPIHFLQIFEDS